MEDITKRITEIISKRKLSNGAFADKIGIKRPIISHILSGRNKPSLHVVLQILDAFPEIDPSWLLLGKSQKVENPPIPQEPLEKTGAPELPFTETKSEEISEKDDSLPSTLLLIEGNEFRIIKKSN
ncbi:helix-turn-helix domain-containing protein [Phaeocystidibacter marisrubri]|uniref:Helix-turn-helix transcriptional regulator n=1 Tax=Phaeocystidibacter marisrubri TaxID=1577780 RepID=A0A6L3ZJX4_9FLAO|nr:helix-turn-helix transcriptional regulator [Phaeocystidibacter marisrubri]KAB2817715.1 helix-turn-helix transcriptional regulator [Phaeocystidibacter marisrubri]GGH73949.1 hypothetical protein GCM10011318_19420 [Phaeocystidibacter marisrubri]